MQRTTANAFLVAFSYALFVGVAHGDAVINTNADMATEAVAGQPAFTFVGASPFELLGRRRKRASIGSSPVVYTYTKTYPYNFLVESKPPDSTWQNYLVMQHNMLRASVPATNMRYVYWDNTLAATAQAHANRCDFDHSGNRQNIGENIWVAPYADYSGAVKLWFDEYADKSCGCQHFYKHCCGHYTQVAWAETSLVGCGFAQCRDIYGANVQGRGHRFVLVCHYNPAGNKIYVYPGRTIYEQAFRFTNSTHGKCSDCPDDAKQCWQGSLCYGSQTRL
jgi:hypothetical protein